MKQSPRIVYPLILLLCCAMPEAWAGFVVDVGVQERLSQTLGRELSVRKLPSSGGEPYLPGLSWRVPEERVGQERIRMQLLEYLRDEKSAPGVSRADAEKLAALVESMPATGRVLLEETDPRWLESHPAFDPVLQQGQQLIIPSRPASVTVLRGDGRICRIGHAIEAYAPDYVQRCDAGWQPQTAWIVQPDGRVQRRNAANWNEEAQDPPAPGAWIVADDPSIPWPRAILEQVARLLATQGAASDKDIAQILPQPVIQNEVITGQAGRPRNLQLTSSDWGTVGLMQTPTARMESAGNASITVSRTAPYTRTTGSMQLMDWLELSVRWVDISNRLYGPASFSGSQSYKDKNIDIKLKLSDETALLPQLALGLRDLGGTGLFSGEYVVASKRTGNLDWSLGLGWGYLGGRGNLGNPLSIFGSKLNVRQTSTAATGQADTSSYLTGPTALFGGVQYQTPWDPLLLKLEYDGNNYRHEPYGNNQKQTTPLNAGLVYRWVPAIDISLGWERGTTLGLGLNFHGDLSKLAMPKLSDPEPEPVSSAYPSAEPDWKKVTALLEEKTSWRVLQIKRAGSELVVRFERADAMYWNAYIDRIASVLHRYVPSRNIMVFRIQSAEYDLGLHEYLIDRAAWVEAQTTYAPAHRHQAALLEREAQPGFVYPRTEDLLDQPPQRFSGKTGISIDHSFGGPEGFLYKIGWGGTGNWHFRPDTWWTSSIDYRLLHNYNKFIYPGAGKGTLPRVRTYVEEFAGTSVLTMPVFQMTHVGKLDNENFYSVYGGMLESMYGGVGAEWLYRPWQSRVAFGVDVNAVRQRGFAQNFAFRDYRIKTGHASLYWDTGVYGINATVRVGQYLAGDRGATLELSRVFQNGTKMSAFATKTNVSAAQFGEGSFDKGFYVSIPFDALMLRSSADVANLVWHPLTRDGGALLGRKFPLFDLTAKQAGHLLERGPYDAEKRTTQFGDVSDSFPDAAHESVFTTASHDLAAMGHTATTQDFWRSMLMIGGVSLASAILDKPADKFAVRHGNNPTMKGVEAIGNFLPVAAAGFSGLMYLTSDPDSRLARASYSSLAAGGVGFLGATGLKYVVGRARPNLERGSASFTPISKSNSNSSWPSGHTTIMWAAVTPYAKAYDAPWLYGLAAVTNVARIGGRNHWLSDTVGGALLGYAVGDFMWESHRKAKKGGAEWAVSPNGVTAYWHIE